MNLAKSPPCAIIVDLADVEKAPHEVQAFSACLQCRSLAREQPKSHRQASECDVISTTRESLHDEGSRLDNLRQEVVCFQQIIRERLSRLLRQIRLAKAQSFPQTTTETHLWEADVFDNLSKITSALETEINRSAAPADQTCGDGIMPDLEYSKTPFQPRALKRFAGDESREQTRKKQKQQRSPEDLANTLLGENAASCFERHVTAYAQMLCSGHAIKQIAKDFTIVRSDNSEAGRLTEAIQYLTIGVQLDADSDLYRMLSWVALITAVRKLDRAATEGGYQHLPQAWITRLHQRVASNTTRSVLKNKLTSARRFIDMFGDFEGLIAFVERFTEYEKSNEDKAKKVNSFLRRNISLARQLHVKGQRFIDCVIAGKKYDLVSDTRVAGPQLQLVMQWTVPDTAQSIAYAMEGNIAGLTRLFKEGLASPNDVSSSRQYSLIRWALYGGMHQHPTVQFLMSMGAVVDEESYKHVWDFSFRLKCDESEHFALGRIRSRPDWDWIDDQNFPSIHKIILGIERQSLMAELVQNPGAVNLKDAEGRTALDWATARAQLDDMRVLIDRSSAVDTIDASGRSTVLHAVDSHNIAALQIILEAGANANPDLPGGVGRSSPLTSATFGGLDDMTSLLLQFGAKIDTCNPEGRTPLATSIIHNEHKILGLFAGACKKYTHLEGPPLLPIIAAHANADTIAALASCSAFLRMLDLHCTDRSREILGRRRDNDELRPAFEGLLTAAHSERRGV